MKLNFFSSVRLSKFYPKAFQIKIEIECRNLLRNGIYLGKVINFFPNFWTLKEIRAKEKKDTRCIERFCHVNYCEFVAKIVEMIVKLYCKKRYEQIQKKKKMKLNPFNVLVILQIQLNELQMLTDSNSAGKIYIFS